MDMLVLTILAVISGTKDWVAVERFGEWKKDWLQTFLELPNGIACHDMLQESFLSWSNALVTMAGREIILSDKLTKSKCHP